MEGVLTIVGPKDRHELWEVEEGLEETVPVAQDTSQVGHALLGRGHCSRPPRADL